MYEHTDLNVHDFVSFVSNGRTPNLTLKIPLCKSTTFKRLLFQTTLILPLNSFSIISSFKRHLKETYAMIYV